MTGAPHPGAGGPWCQVESLTAPSFALTGGRVRPRHAMRLDTVLTPGAAGHATGPHAAGIDDGAGAAGAPEAAHALGLCRVRDCTVAEIAATLGRPVPVTKIILSDLLDCGALAVAVPAAATDPVTGRPAPQVLEALLAGLRNHHAAV